MQTRGPAPDAGTHSAGQSCLSTSRGVQDENIIGESSSSRLVGINTPHKEKARRNGAGGPTETALFDASENPSGNENDEGPEKGTRANHENGRPAT